MTLQLLLSFFIALAVSSLFGKYFIPWLRRQKAGQEIKDIGPNWHKAKTGTPTMGGVMFILAAFLSIATVGFSSVLKGNYVHFIVFLFAFVFGLIGFLDDWEKIKNKQNLGLTAKKKFALQLVAAAGFIVLLKNLGYLKTELFIPFFKATVSVNPYLYYIFAAFVMVGTVNAVNITDGIDGLASGTSLPVFLFYSLLPFSFGVKYLELGIFASSMLGGLVGFLLYNYNPAKVFMGDTGSLFLGGAVAALAFAYDMPLILITLGIIFIIETLSDIIQVGYFKLTHGKRIFKMAPFHHHLEMGGWTGRKWKEKEIFWLFTSVSFIFSVISYFGVFDRYC